MNNPAYEKDRNIKTVQCTEVCYSQSDNTALNMEFEITYKYTKEIELEGWMGDDGMDSSWEDVKDSEVLVTEMDSNFPFHPSEMYAAIECDLWERGHKKVVFKI